MANHKKQTSKSPIGIFDSGIGGLTVARAINKIMPNEQLIYFGDTAHFPYGEKSPDSIKYYALRISDFLLKQNCKMIVIACNTASSVAYQTVKNQAGNKALVVSVIEPVVNNVANQYKQGKIGVIATKGTIKSDIYNKRLKELNTSLQVSSVATPLLAPMIEEGFYNNNISRTVINSYLLKPKLKNIDALILACTHYPLIRPEIEEYYKQKVKIIDSAEIVAEHVYALLKEHRLLNKDQGEKSKFYVSDYTDSFAKSTKIFYNNKIKLQYNPIWENE
ncbi:MAG: glutamate racemase [Bacteroidia bacterium]|nr:glutamate racemase [Bacteroidia bacterium]MCZ2247328.1 glutamate racemase [Bacteroidia bacterium]